MDSDIPTDEQLAAAIERGIAAGTIIEVDDAFLARLAAEVDDPPTEPTGVVTMAWTTARRSVEFGVGDPDDCDDPDSVSVVSGPSGLTRVDRTYGRALLQRDVWRSPWKPAAEDAPELAAASSDSLAGQALLDELFLLLGGTPGHPGSAFLEDAALGVAARMAERGVQLVKP